MIGRWTGIWAAAAVLTVLCIGPSDHGCCGPTLSQETCPVSGAPARANYFVDYDGHRVHFCCEACPSEFAKAPDRYMAEMAARSVRLASAPPISAPPVLRAGSSHGCLTVPPKKPDADRGAHGAYAPAAGPAQGSATDSTAQALTSPPKVSDQERAPPA